MGVVISEHRLPYTVPNVQRMVALQRGRIVLDGAPEQLLVQDVELFGLELPLPVRVGRRLGLPRLPLSVEVLQSLDLASPLPSDLKTVPPAFPSAAAEIVLESALRWGLPEFPRKTGRARIITEIDIASTNLLKLFSLPGPRDRNQIQPRHNRL